MLIAEAGRIAADAIRHTKEQVVLAIGGQADIAWVVDSYRGNNQVASVTIAAEDGVLEPIAMMAYGFAPDVIALSSEGYFTEGDSPLNDPRTGEPWQPGAMSSYVEAFGLEGVVKQALITAVVNRAGDLAVIQQAYVVKGSEVEWLPPDEDRLRFDAGGVSESLREIMSMSTASVDAHIAAAVKMGLDVDRARDFMDAACVESLQEFWPSSVNVALFAKKGSLREQTLRTKLDRAQVVDLSGLS